MAVSDGFSKARRAATDYSEMLTDSGPLALGKHLLGQSKAEWKLMGEKGTRWVRGGVGLTIAGPTLTMDGNWGGILSTATLPKDFWKAVTNQPDSPDLQVTASAAVAPSSLPDPHSPVMHD